MDEQKKIIEVEGVFTIQKFKKKEYWYSIHIGSISKWMYCHIPLSYPIRIKGKLLKAGDLVYIELHEALPFGEDGQSINSILDKLDQEVSVNCVCKFKYKYDTGYWYTITDMSGSIELFSKHPIWVKAKIRVIEDQDYYWVQTPLLSKDDVSYVYAGSAASE